MAAKKKPAKGGKPAGRRPGKRGAWPSHIRLLVILLSLLLGLVLLLALLAPVRRWLGQEPPAPVPVAATVTQTETSLPADRRQPPTREELQVELESFLWRAGAAKSRISEVAGERFPVWQVGGDFPSPALRRELRRELQQLDADLTLADNSATADLTILWQKVPHFRLRFQPLPTPPPPASGAVARMVIIMDDLGRDLATAQALANIDLPVTFAILPNAAEATAVAELAHRRSREVLVHLPMEPLNYPGADPGPDALWLSTAPQEVRRLLDEYFRRVPHAVGGNNHMGSRFTSDPRAMVQVLAVMRDRRAFFVDSFTTPASVAVAEAARMGVPALRRDVFLDNDARIEPIRAQLRKLADLAAHRGSAVGICHPHAATLEALRREAPAIKRRGIEVVPASRLLAG